MAHASTFAPTGPSERWSTQVAPGMTGAFEILSIDLEKKRIGVALVPEGSARAGQTAPSQPEIMPGARLTFTTAANTPEAIAFLAGRPAAERLVFHATCGRLHLWPAADEAASLAKDLAGRGFMLLEARGLTLPSSDRQTPVTVLRRAIRQALDPTESFALGPNWVRSG